jgi:hypothetical protein
MAPARLLFESPVLADMSFATKGVVAVSAFAED